MYSKMYKILFLSLALSVYMDATFYVPESGDEVRLIGTVCYRTEPLLSLYWSFTKPLPLQYWKGKRPLFYNGIRLVK